MSKNPPNSFAGSVKVINVAHIRLPMPGPSILREIHQLRGSGFSFVGDSIYDLRAEFHGKTVQVKLQVEGAKSASISGGGVNRKVPIPDDLPLAQFLDGEIKKTLEVSFLHEEGFSHKEDASGVALTGKHNGKRMEVLLPPAYPRSPARFTLDSYSFEEQIPPGEFIYTRLDDIGERVEAGKDRRLLLKQGFQESGKGTFTGRLESEIVVVTLPQGYPKSPPSVRVGIVHPRLTDEEGYAKLENLATYQWSKDPDLSGVLDALRRRIERVHREVPRLYLETYQLLRQSQLRPVKGNVELWEGPVTTHQGITLDLVVDVPKEFSRIPPRVSLRNVFPNDHIDVGGSVVIPLLTSAWTEVTHIVEVLEDIRSLKRTDLVSMDPTTRLSYEAGYLEKYEPSITQIPDNEVGQYAKVLNREVLGGWAVTIKGEGVLTSRTYEAVILVDPYFPATPPMIKFDSRLDVTERILLFGAIHSPTGLVLFGHPGSGLEWKGEMSLCEALEIVKERLRVRKFEITSSEEFFEEIGNILVSDMVTTFKPLANNIYLWSGEYKALYGAQLKKVHYEVRLSQNYPLSPPRVSVVDPKPFINDNVEADGRVKEEFIIQKHFRRTDLKTVAKLVKTLRPQPKKGLLDKVMGVFR